MPVMIKFYMVVGRDEAYENVIRGVVNEIKDKVKEKNVNATFIRIKPEAVDVALNALSMPEGQVPQNLLYLVKSMKADGVKALPALIINGRKIYEGQLPPPETMRQVIMDEITAQLMPTQPPQQPAQVQQPPSPPPPPPPLPTLPPPPPPQPEVRPSPPESIKEIKPPEAKPPEAKPSGVELVPAVPIQQPLASGVRIVMGRPNDCRECIYYGANTGTCLLFGYKVVDPSKPPCKS